MHFSISAQSETDFRTGILPISASRAPPISHTRLVLELFLGMADDEAEGPRTRCGKLVLSMADPSDDEADSAENLVLETFVRALTSVIKEGAVHFHAASDVSATKILADTKPADDVITDSSNPNLSPRESEILEFVMRGESNKHIARRLTIAEPTVKSHIKSILRKIHARNRFEAAMWAMRMKSS